jgi:hypothetical protein
LYRYSLATGFISFESFIRGMAKFHDCQGTRGVNVAFRLMDSNSAGSVGGGCAAVDSP